MIFILFVDKNLQNALFKGVYDMFFNPILTFNVLILTIKRIILQ
jgi:hypothetical protein